MNLITKDLNGKDKFNIFPNGEIILKEYSLYRV